MGKRVTVAMYLDRSSAEIAKGFLESSGIHAIVNADDMGGNRPYLGYGPGIRLTVDQKDEVEARGLLKSVENHASGGSASAPPPSSAWTRAFRLSVFGLLIPLIPSLAALYVMLRHGSAIKGEKGSRPYYLLLALNLVMILLVVWIYLFTY